MSFPLPQDVPEIDYCIKSLKNLKGISIASLNICHLLPKLDDIKHILTKSDLDILCLCETFLDSEILDSELQIDGYSFFRHDRTPPSGKSCGGGLIIYVKNSRDVKLIEAGSHCSPDLE